MQNCCCKGKEKHHQYLGIDTPSNILFRHTHLLHNCKTALILIAFCHLLLVDNEHRCKKEHDGQNDTKIENPSKGSVKLITLCLTTFHAVGIETTLS